MCSKYFKYVYSQRTRKGDTPTSELYKHSTHCNARRRTTADRVVAHATMHVPAAERFTRGPYFRLIIASLLDARVRVFHEYMRTICMLVTFANHSGRHTHTNTHTIGRTCHKRRTSGWDLYVTRKSARVLRRSSAPGGLAPNCPKGNWQK